MMQAAEEPEYVSPTQAELLSEALKRAGLSNREAGARLAELSEGTLKPENARSSIVRWRRGGGISDENAERLSLMLDLPADYFKKPQPEPDELAHLRGLAVNLLREIERTMRRLEHQAPPERSQ